MARDGAMFSFALLILREDAAGLAKIGDGEVWFDAGREFMFVLLGWGYIKNLKYNVICNGLFP